MPLALPALSAGYSGVASEWSGNESVCESALARAGNRQRSGFPEDSAVPSGDNKAVRQVRKAPCSAAVRIYYKEGTADMQREFRAEIEVNMDVLNEMWRACKNVPNGCGAG